MTDNDLEYKNQIKDNLAVGAKGGAIAFILKISSTILGFLNQIVLARILGAGGIGEVILAITVVRIAAQIAKFGMEEAMMRFVPLYIDRNDDARLKGAIYFSLFFCLVISLVLAFFVAVFSRLIAISVFHSENLVRLLPLIVISIPASVIRDVIGGILRGYKEAFRSLLPENLISPFFRLAIFLLLSLNGVSPFQAIIAYITGEILSSFLSIKFLLSKIKNIAPVKRIYERKRILEVAFTIILTGISVLLYTQADIVILGMFTSAETVGIYGVASRLVLLVYFPMMAFATAIPSLISSIHTSGDMAELRKVVSESTRWILSTAMPIILILFLEGEYILKYFYGPEFAAGYIVLLILTLGQLVKAGAGLVGVILQMTGEHKVYMKVNIIWGIVNIILNVLLVPRFGMIGAAISTAVCLAMIDIICIFIIYNKLSVVTLAKGLKFDVVFIAIVAVIYLLLSYSKIYIGHHVLLLTALIVYLWKSFYNHDIPWRFLIAKYKEA